MLVILNFSTEVVEYELPVGVKVDSVIVETEKGAVDVNEGAVILQAYSGALYCIATKLVSMP
jgi:hypothetical protein